MDIRRCRVVLLFCLSVGVDVCLGKVPPCVSVNQYIFSLPIGPDSSSETEPHPVEREREKEEGKSAEENWGKECWGN